jgi:prostaglandin-H2 D-isomerase / glutathione transferase
MNFPRIKFTYFDKVDRPEPIRLAMIVADIPFEDVRVSDEQWQSMMQKAPFGKLPIMEINDAVYSQSNALLRYIGHIGSLLSTDPLQALRVDEVIGVIDDIIFAVKPTLHINDRSMRISKQESLSKDYIPHLFQGLDKSICHDSRSFSVGNQYSIADIALYNLIEWFKTGQYSSSEFGI